jgi:hypothetical protein
LIAWAAWALRREAARPEGAPAEPSLPARASSPPAEPAPPLALDAPGDPGRKAAAPPRAPEPREGLPPVAPPDPKEVPAAAASSFPDDGETGVGGEKMAEKYRGASTEDLQARLQAFEDMVREMEKNLVTVKGGTVRLEEFEAAKRELEWLRIHVPR